MSKKQRDQRPRPDTLATLLMPNYEQKLEENLGNRLRELRRQQALSLRALAEKSGLSANTLSLIENGKTSPSVATLQQIAIALNIPITAFFESKITREPVIYTQKDRRVPTTFNHGALEDLGAGLGADGLQPFIVAVNPHAESTPQSMSQDGMQFVYCIHGRVIYSVMGEEYTLNSGDSLLFSSKMPHAWRNPQEEPSNLLIVIAPGEEKRRPVQLHYPL
jgi:transcriptional regulator with XRE-family HTH domain